MPVRRKRSRALPREVALVGAGMSHFGVFKEKTSRDLFAEAFEEMRASVDKGFEASEIESLYVGNFASDVFEGQGHLAPILAGSIGLISRPATRVENACASGGTALRQGVIEIASGMADLVLVGGVESMSHLNTAGVTDALSAAGDMLYEMSSGVTFPGVFATIATAYMKRYGMRPEHLMHVAMKDHENGALNPRAQFRATIQQIMQSRAARIREKGGPAPQWADELDFLTDEAANPYVAWPLRLFDCSPVTDGAACLLLASGERALEFTDDPIYITGSGQASDYPLSSHAELTSLNATRLAAQSAYEMAGISAADICLAEVHDCFTIAEIVATEDLDLFEAGTAFRAVEDGVTSREGRLPINTSGGLKAKGHPVGASGAAQVVEIFEQMRGRAGPRQAREDVPLALTQNLGGTGATSVVHIFERK